MSDATYRRVNVSILIDLWTWEGEAAQKETIDVSDSVLNYRWQKSIKNPQGSCQLNMTPQLTERGEKNIMDVLRPMDVVRIFEFGQLKFIGFVQRVSYGGSIQPGQGEPKRNATITCQQFGGLFVSGNIGLGLGTALRLEAGDPADDPLRAAAVRLQKAILDATVDGVRFAELITLLYGNYREYLTAIGADKFLNYLDVYLDVSSGLTSAEAPAIPRTVEIYTGMEESLTFWQLAEQLVQKPFYEFWIDSGPRKVHVDGQDVTLPEKSCFVFRGTPFNGTVTNAGTGSAFDLMPEVNIERGYLLSFNLSRSMDEAYTFYSVKQAAFQLSDIARLLLGIAKVDEARVGKYLFRPLITELFYTRVEDIVGEERAITEGDVERAGDQASQTLLNWFENNDEFLSGTLSMMVPDENTGLTDPRIGDKASVYGIEGFFYVEGVSHTWTYGGALKSDLTVTRGFNRGSPIELTDRIFKRNRIK